MKRLGLVLLAVALCVVAARPSWRRAAYGMASVPAFSCQWARTTTVTSWAGYAARVHVPIARPMEQSDAAIPAQLVTVVVRAHWHENAGTDAIP